MDITDISPNLRTIDLAHPGTGAPVGVKITLRPDSHPEVVKATRKAQNARLNSRNGKLSAEKLEAASIDYLAASIDGWDWSGGEMTFHGDKPEFTPANVRRFLTEVLWARKQIDEELTEDADFFSG